MLYVGASNGNGNLERVKVELAAIKFIGFSTKSRLMRLGIPFRS